MKPAMAHGWRRSLLLWWRSQQTWVRWSGTALLTAIGLGSTALLALCLWPQPSLWGDADFSTLVVDREGRILRLTLTQDDKYRLFTPLGAMPGELVEATLLYEDRAFWRHPGVNVLALGRALGGMIRGGRRMGASTITMQVVRLSQGFSTATIPGKLRQMWQALVLERHYTKAEILEAYFNLAPYGGNVEGMGAAARVWFNKDPALLSLPEILALVPVPQHPAARNPLAQQGKALPAARLRLDEIWREAHPNTYDPIFARSPLQVYGPAHLPFEAPHLVDSLLQQEDTEGLVVTGIDLARQRILEESIRQAVGRGRAWGMENAAALLVDWRTMDIVALAGSADFHNEAIHGQVDGTRARRSPGSILKPFIYALALEQGLIHPQTILADTPQTFRGYTPENSDNLFQGPLTAKQALQRSRNIPAINLAGRLREPGLYGFLTRSGVTLEHGADHYGLALVLGGAEVTMREVAALYAMLPNRGFWQPLRLRLEQIPSPVALRHPFALGTEDHWSEQGEGTAAELGRQNLLPEAAFVALDMLHTRPLQGFGRLPVYWKTGTSNGQRDAWTAGVFGPYVLVVWVGEFTGGSNPGLTGLKAAAPLFFDIVQALSGRERLTDLPQENREELNLTRLAVCQSTGDINTDLCARSSNPATVETWFIPGVSPIRDSGILREIIVHQESGLRHCRDIPHETERQVWEYWPADVRRLFAEAGVYKTPPPAWHPLCGEGGQDGLEPQIISPQPGVVHAMRLAAPAPIPLLANVEADVDTVFWFAGTRFLGRSAPEEPLLWDPLPGVTQLRVVDNQGRTGSLRVQVEARP